MKNLARVLMLILWCGAAGAQTVTLKVQLWSNNSPVSNYTVLAEGQSGTTNDAGIFLATVKSTLTQLTIQPSDNHYIIVYPQGGKVLVPKDPSLVTQVILQPFKSNVYIDQYLTAFKQLRDSSGKSQQQLQAIRKQVDALTKQLTAYHYSNQDLAAVRERQNGKDLSYPAISTSLQNYVNQATSLCAAFQYSSAFAFENHNALEQLVQAVNNFNPAYNDLFTNRNIYAQKIQAYWQDEQLNAAYKGITDTLLEVIGKQTILPLNDLKTRINAYFTGQVSNQDKGPAKKQIQDQVAVIVPVLNKQLRDISLSIQNFQEQLKK